MINIRIGYNPMIDGIYYKNVDKLDDFFRKFKLIKYNKKALIYVNGENEANMYYLKTGFLRVFRISEDGDEFTYAILKSGDLFPLTYWINTSDINQYFFEAITNLQIYKSSKSIFLSFIKSNPDVLYNITNNILMKFDGVLYRIENLIFNNAYIKTAKILMSCAIKFGKRKNNGNILITIPLTHHDIASMAGITRETTSLELKKLMNRGFILKTSRYYEIRNMEDLKKEIYVSTHEHFSVDHYSI
jgi:CRP-like cAMP-binding protein